MLSGQPGAGLDGPRLQCCGDRTIEFRTGRAELRVDGHSPSDYQNKAREVVWVSVSRQITTGLGLFESLAELASVCLPDQGELAMYGIGVIGTADSTSASLSR